MSRQSAGLSTATHHTMPPELIGKWGWSVLTLGFPLNILLPARYRVKLKKYICNNKVIRDLVIFSRSGKNSKCGVKLRHSQPNISKIG